MNVGFLAEQVGPATMHAQYARAFATYGTKCVAVDRNSIDQPDSLDALTECDVVCSDPFFVPDCTRSLALSRELHRRGIRMVILEDQPNKSIAVHQGKSVAHDAPELIDCLVAATSMSKEVAQRAGMEAYFFGYPIHWRDSLQEMEAGEHHRTTLAIRRRGSGELDILGDRQMLYLPGFKSRRKEDDVIQQLLNASEALAARNDRLDREHLVLQIRPHPGETNPALHTPEQLALSDAWRSAALQGIWEVQSEQAALQGPNPNAFLYGAADLTFAVGRPTETITAMIRRKVGLHIVDVLEGFDGMQWEPVRVGALPGATLAHVRQKLERILHATDEERGMLLQRQEQYYPEQDTSKTAERIHTFLAERYGK